MTGPLLVNKDKAWHYAGPIVVLFLAIDEPLKPGFWRVVGAVLACASVGFLISALLGFKPRRWAAPVNASERRSVVVLALAAAVSLLVDSRGHGNWQIIFGS